MGCGGEERVSRAERGRRREGGRGQADEVHGLQAHEGRWHRHRHRHGRARLTSVRERGRNDGEGEGEGAGAG